MQAIPWCSSTCSAASRWAARTRSRCSESPASCRRAPRALLPRMLAQVSTANMRPRDLERRAHACNFSVRNLAMVQ